MGKQLEEVVSQEEIEQLEKGDESRVTTNVYFSAWVSPLPPPEDLQKYNQIVQGAGERLLKMAEAEQSHRIYRERAAISIGRWGLVVGAVVTVLIAVGGLWLVNNGRTWGGVSVIAGVAGVFVWGTKPHIKFGNTR